MAENMPNEQTGGQRPVFENLPPEQQQALTDEVGAMLQFFIDTDLSEHGELTDGTLEAITVQGYAYRDGNLEKQAEQEQAQRGPSDAKQAVTYYPISEETARRAKEAISQSDYRPGSATAEYRQCVDEAVEIAQRQKARVDPMYHDKIDRLLNAYAFRLAANINNRNEITARVSSVLLAGPSNFPVRQKEKQNAASDRNMEEWREIRGLLEKIRSTGMGGISADDPSAIQKLQDKLAGLQKAQDTMKAVNAYYRKNKTLDGCPDLSEERIARLKAGMARDWRGASAKPFESYNLSNNNAEIRRVKERIEALTRHNETVYTGWEFEGGRVEANKEDNRLQIFFDEKPDADKRSQLKSNGFRWAPSVKAWQRQLTTNAFYAANRVDCIQPLTGEKPLDLQKKARQEPAVPAPQPEPDAWDDVDPAVIRENLAKAGIVNGQVVDPDALDNSPFIQQVKADVERFSREERPSLAGKLKEAQQTAGESKPDAGREKTPAKRGRDCLE